MKKNEHVLINGVKILPFKSFDELIDYSIDKEKILVAINPRKIDNDNTKLKNIINQNIGYIDSLIAKLIVQKKLGTNVPKLPGCDIWLKLIEKYQESKSFYLIGATQKVVESTVLKLEKEYPSLDILGYRNGYFNTKKEKEKLFQDLQAQKPDVVFVAMGSPLQEYVMKECMEHHSALYQGLGGSFDLYVGKKKRPPKFLRDMGLEGVSITITEGIRQPKMRFLRLANAIKMLFNTFLGKY